MKGNEKLIKKLDELLAEELTAINQYMVHSEMCDSWGYQRLHKVVEKRAIDEMKHAEKLIGRILFLEGRPTVSKLNPIEIGADVPKQLEADRKAEADAVKSYNDAIQLAGEVGDNATRDLLIDILKDEDDHMDNIEEQLDQIAQMGAGIYLSIQTQE
ncbi:MAG: bacterioferritin [Pirellulales bacterium]|nr:bacterioferritin [Pirellulales bacterium]